MNLTTFTNRRYSARFFAGITIVSLLLSAFPAAFFVANAANTDAVGEVTLTVLPAPTGGATEYVKVGFSGSGTLDLEGWTIEDVESSPKVVYTFGATTLSDGDEFKICGLVSAGCDDETQAGGNTVWTNSGDTAVLKDEAGVVVLTTTWLAISQANDAEFSNSVEVDYSSTELDAPDYFCKARGSGEYHKQTLTPAAAQELNNGEDAGLMGSGVNANNIIPAFDDFAGFNWDSVENQTLWENDCEGDSNQPPVDVCPNLDGVQVEIPEGSYINDAGDCVPRIVEPEAPQTCSLAGEIIAYTENPVQNNGQPVKNTRRTLTALDSIGATSNFFGKESPFNESDFFSLGIEGYLVYEFTDKVAVDGPGNDIAIWEVTGGTSGQSNEKAEVFFSEDGVNFVSVGIAQGDAAFDISGTGLDFVKFVKLVDKSSGVQGGNGDGYDVDAITIIEGSCSDYVTIETTKIICEDESLLPNGGYQVIDGTTATDFLAGLAPEDQGKCRLATEDEFSFQWALGGVRIADAPNNDGELGGPWQTPVPTNDAGLSTAVILADMLGNTSQISVREVMDADNYLPFSGTGGSDVTAELYCHTDAANFDNLEWISGVQTDVTYHCVAWNVPLEKESEVTVCKYDEEQNPLSGWQLALLGEKVDEVSVLPNGNEYKIEGAPAGDYVLKASNAYVYRPTNLLADAAFSERLPGDPGFGTYPYQPWRITQLLNQHLGVKVNGDAMVWGTVFNPTHVYYTSWNPTDVSNDGIFQITDTQYNDNRGSILVEAFTGYTGVTGENGCVTFEDVPFGEYEIEELLQLDWENVSGLGPVVVDAENDTFAVVNRDLTETPVATLVAEKIVCEAEEYLPNWNDQGKAPKITASTAADYVAASDGKCWLEDDWYFEWAPQNTANPDNDLPDTAFYGVAGGNWTTFGPTDGSGKAQVSLTADDIDGDRYIWVREVLREDYIPFTYGPGNTTNSDNKTAEFYCHADGKNYDNYDRVDGIAVDKTYHCVAFNTEIEKPIEQCTLDIFSDTGTLVDETNEFAVATYDGNRGWTADIPGATWIWATDRVEDPENDETYTFVETFEVTNPTSAAIDVAYDNWLVLYVNGELIDDRTGTNGYRDFQQQDYDILSELVPGENRIEFVVTNEGLNNRNYRNNPAGVLFKISIAGDARSCERTTKPESEDEKYLIDGYKYEWVGLSDRIEVSTEGLDNQLAVVLPPSGLGLSGWTIELYDGEGEFITSTTTDGDGYYYFHVPAGEYEVREVMQDGWEQYGVQDGYEYVYPENGPHTCEFELPYEYDYPAFNSIATFIDNEEYSYSDFRCNFLNVRVDDEEEDEDEEIRTFSRSSNVTGTRVDRRATPQPLVLGESVSRCEFLNDHMQMGIQNDSFEVMKLQLFLKMIMGYDQPVTGFFGATTDANVKRFQETYRSEVLDPWYERGIVPHNRPTGFVYKTTKWKINDIVCPGWDPYPSFEDEDLTTDVSIGATPIPD